MLPSATDPDAPLAINARHRTQLESAVRFLDAFLAYRSALGYQGTDVDILEPTLDSELAAMGDLVCSAEELRYAAQAIGKITGRIDVEDVLEVIFRDFCIGK